MDFSDLKTYFSLTKDVLELFKSTYALLPKGSARDEIERKISAAEEIMRRSDAKLAKELGYNLCQCRFPPEIMLWRQQEDAWVCQNGDCGARKERNQPRPPMITGEGRLAKSRRGEKGK
jgi:hypothetical protein